jgi:hypothetical protein
MLNGVGGRYCKIVEVATVPTTPQLLTPLAEILPPVKPVLKLTVMLELSEVAEVMVVLSGFVHLKLAMPTCAEVGVLAIAVKVFEDPIQTAKSPPTVVMPATVAGVVFVLMITVFAILIEQGVTDFTESVSFTKQEANVTITAVSFSPAAFMCVIVALVPLFKYQL